MLVDPPIRRTCRECGAKLVLAQTDPGPENVVVEIPDCPGCGAKIRPLTPSERERVLVSVRYQESYYNDLKNAGGRNDL